MQLNRLGKIEEESTLSDLDQLEHDLEHDIEDDVNNAAPAPRVNAAPPAASVSSFMTPATRNAKSKFAGTRVSSFFPGQPTISLGKQGGAPQSLMPQSYMEKRRSMKVAANDARPTAQSKFATAPKQSAAKTTIAALMSLGKIPLQLLTELGRLRYARERQFNSLLRLEKALGQGHEDGEQFLRLHPNALKKPSSLPKP
jgi:hypothetical protein